jgi:hypothetical protein
MSETDKYLDIWNPGRQLPPELVTQTVVDVGKKGAGKSYLLGVFEEEFAKRKIPFTVIDPVGAHWGIKEKYEVYVFGGSQPDVALDFTIGKEVADITVSSGMSNILDIHDLSNAAQRKFVADFCEELYQKNQSPRHLIIEEADLFIPQRISSDTARVYNAVDNLIRRGRQRGLGVSVASQRPALLNKDTTSQADLYLFFRMPGTQDRDAVKGFLEGVIDQADVKRIYGQLPTLKTGHCLLYSPEWLQIFGMECTVRERETFHAGRTPKLGEKLGFKPIPVAADDLKKQIQEFIGQRETELTELQDVKRQLDSQMKLVSELNRRLEIREEVKDMMGTNRGVSSRDYSKLAAGLEEKYAATIADLNNSLKIKTDQLTDAQKELAELQPYVDLKDSLARILNGKTLPIVQPDAPATAATAALLLTRLHEAPRKVLQYLVDHPGVKFSKNQLAALTGYASSGGTYGDALRTLKRNDVIRISGDEVTLK